MLAESPDRGSVVVGGGDSWVMAPTPGRSFAALRMTISKAHPNKAVAARAATEGLSAAVVVVSAATFLLRTVMAIPSAAIVILSAAKDLVVRRSPVPASPRPGGLSSIALPI